MSKRWAFLLLKSAALLGGFMAAVSVARALDSRFDYYIGMVLRARLSWSFAAGLFALLACAALFAWCEWRADFGMSAPVWRKTDYFLLALGIYCFIILCAAFVLIYTTPFGLLIAFAMVYAAAALLVSETVAREKASALLSSCSFVAFFKLYPVNRLIAWVIALPVMANALYLFLICPVQLLRATELNAPMFLFCAFTLAALSYFCSFVTSLSAEYEKANADKIRSERFKVELITNVSHDIRTPLTSIINYVDLLKALPVERDDFKDYVAVLDKKTARLKTLINDLMDASKASTGNVALNPQRVNLSEIVGQLAGEFDDTFNDRGLTFVFRQPDEPVFVTCDSAHLWRVLENIFGNAAKYSLSGTRVFAEIEARGGFTAFLLKNTSQNPIDLPAEELTEQFIRGDRARQTNGYGLGLYIAKSLTELMGGVFTVRVTGDLFEAGLVFK